MERRRTETVAVLLIALAGSAASLSVVITLLGSAPPVQAKADEPRRTSEPLRWPLADLPPLTMPVLADAQTTLLSRHVASQSMSIANPWGDPALRVAVAPDPLTTRPLRFRVASDSDGRSSSAFGRQRLVVLLPNGPRWEVGDSVARVVPARRRAAWSVGPIDTLAIAREAGRLLASSQLVPASKQTSGDKATDHRRFAAAATSGSAIPQPQPVTPTRRQSFVRPIVRPVALPVEGRQAAVDPTTIEAYLSRSTQAGAFPRPLAAAAQLDRVAESRELAPWAWAVAYRLRTLNATEIDNRTAHRAMVSLSDAADEAFARAASLANEQQATELRRAGYALTRRLATWRAEQTITLANRQCGNAGGLLASQDRLAGARWAMSSNGLGISPGAMLIDPTDEARDVDRSPVLRVAQRLESYEQRPTS
ncbi:MAG: hypothetical protein AAF266_09280, partial [Planctomycetota bacterium]